MRALGRGAVASVHAPRGRRKRSGFTLIEAMVSLVIALLVIGALLSTVIASLQAGAFNDALAQITEDASLALAVMRQQVAQAGFGAAMGGAVGHPFPPVLGCAAANFRDVEAGVLAPPSCGAPGSPAASDALEVAYEASVLPARSSNAILGAKGGADDGRPLDCLGNAVPSTRDPAAGDYALNDSKFYVSADGLYCHGPGSAGGAALVQNVELLRVRYGMAAVAAGRPGADQVVGYDAAPAIGAPAWAQVVAIRLCVQLRSAAKVLAPDSRATLGAYVDCDGVARSSADGYLRRTFSTTVALQGRLP